MFYHRAEEKHEVNGRNNFYQHKNKSSYFQISNKAPEVRHCRKKVVRIWVWRKEMAIGIGPCRQTRLIKINSRKFKSVDTSQDQRGSFDHYLMPRVIILAAKLPQKLMNCQMSWLLAKQEKPQTVEIGLSTPRNLQHVLGSSKRKLKFKRSDQPNTTEILGRNP